MVRRQLRHDASRHRIAGIFWFTIFAGIFITYVKMPAMDIALDIFPQIQVTEQQFSAARNNAESARLNLAPMVGEVTIRAAATDEILTADVDVISEVVFDVRGGPATTIDLRQVEGVEMLSAFSTSINDIDWDITLSDAIPLDLYYVGGSGDLDMDLRGVQLTNLLLEGAIGRAEIKLPATGDRYTTTIEAGVGEVRVDIVDDAQLDMTIESGLGDFTVRFGDNVDATLTATSGLGKLIFDVDDDSAVRLVMRGEQPDSFVLPEGYVQVARNTYETENYAESATHIIITFNGNANALVMR